MNVNAPYETHAFSFIPTQTDVTKGEFRFLGKLVKSLILSLASARILEMLEQPKVTQGISFEVPLHFNFHSSCSC